MVRPEQIEEDSKRLLVSKKSVSIIHEIASIVPVFVRSSSNFSRAFAVNEVIIKAETPICPPFVASYL